MPNLTSMSATVGALLKERQQTIAVTESSCGGLISASLVAVPGCSAFYVGGATIYTRTAQYGLLHVAESAFEGIQSSTEPYALMNSRNVRAALGTTWALSETGASGPTGGSHGNDPGHSCMAVVGPVERSIGRLPSRLALPTGRRTCGFLPRRHWSCWRSASGSQS